MISIKEKIRNRIYQVIGDRFEEPVLHFKDQEEPSLDDPIVRFVLVSSHFDGMDPDSKDTFMIVYECLEQSGLFTEFDDYLIAVMPLGLQEYRRFGDSIFEPEEDDDDFDESSIVDRS